MLLFSTMLDIVDTFTPEDFIKLVIYWNQTNNRYSDNIIPGLKWTGDILINKKGNNLSLISDTYEKKNIVMVRYQKTSEDGIVWNTDYVMNFAEHKMCIRLDRTFTEDALEIDMAYSNPLFIQHLILSGYVKDDLELDVSYLPHLVNSENADKLIGIVEGYNRYKLPVIYVSKMSNKEYPVDIDRLAYKLKGIGHVLAEEDTSVADMLTDLFGDKFEKSGSIGIYYPGKKMGHKKYYPQAYDLESDDMLKSIVRAVVQYSNAQAIDPLYTWQGIKYEQLTDAISKSQARYFEAEDKRQHQIEAANEQLEELWEKYAELENKYEEQLMENQRLMLEKNAFENYRNRAIAYRDNSDGIFTLGDDGEYFQDETKLIILDILKQYVKNAPDGFSRRVDVVNDIIQRNSPKNDTQNELLNREKILKQCLKGYKTLDSATRNQLEKIGFEITDGGKHYKIAYYGEGRYSYAMPKSGSDLRGGLNLASELAKICF